LPQPVQRVLETAGNMTYSCYLLHFPIQLSIAAAFSFLQVPIPFHDRLFWATFVFGTLLVAHLTYRYFEAPAQRMIRARLSRRQNAMRSESFDRRQVLPNGALNNARHART